MLGKANPYTTLEVAPSANSDEVDGAYRRLRALLDDDQLAAYGMLTAEQVAAQRHELDAAYHLLANPKRRRAYDESQRAPTPTPTRDHAELRDANRATFGRPAGPAPIRRNLGSPRFAAIDPDQAELAVDAAYDGPKLRRLREYAGASLDDLSECTKISRRYLKAIEADDYGLLPARVYVRGFVAAYARMLGLEGPRVAESYVSKMAGAGFRS